MTLSSEPRSADSSVCLCGYEECENNQERDICFFLCLSPTRFQSHLVKIHGVVREHTEVISVAEEECQDLLNSAKSLGETKMENVADNKEK